MAIPNRHFMLIDDDEDDHLIFSEALKKIDKETRFQSAFSAKEGLQILDNSKDNIPDAIFLDINMPVVSGEECLKNIRGVSDLNQVPVIMYSTSLHEITANRLLNFGANYFIRKPGDFNDLINILKKVFRMLESGNHNKNTFDNFIISP